jgi:hypothetical protein
VSVDAPAARPAKITIEIGLKREYYLVRNSDVTLCYWQPGDHGMFESLEETIKHDVAVDTTRTGRIVKATIIALLSVVLFGGLYFAIRMVE